MNLAAFRVRFPEFNSAENELVQSVLDAAANETSSSELGTSYDEAHGLLAAHKLAVSPYGQQGRLDNKEFSTTYEREREAMIARAIAGVLAV